MNDLKSRKEIDDKPTYSTIKAAGADNVNHPKHYTTGEIECIAYIEDKLTPEEFRGYIKGNVIKYITRYRKKNGLEDVRKAVEYINRILADEYPEYEAVVRSRGEISYEL